MVEIVPKDQDWKDGTGSVKVKRIRVGLQKIGRDKKYDEAHRV